MIRYEEVAQRLRYKIGSVTMAVGILATAWGAHVWTMSAIAERVGRNMGDACVAAISRHDAAAEAHVAMRDRETERQQPFAETAKRLAALELRQARHDQLLLELQAKMIVRNGRN